MKSERDSRIRGLIVELAESSPNPPTFAEIEDLASEPVGGGQICPSGETRSEADSGSLLALTAGVAEMESVTGSRRSPVLWRRPVVVASGFAMLILLVIGVPILLAGGGGGNEATVATESTTPPTTVATESTTPPTTVATESTTPPTTQTQPRCLQRRFALSPIVFEAWFVDLHGAIGALVEDTNGLGLALLETEDFSPGWENREPVSSTLALLVADLDVVESMATDVLQVTFGATYTHVYGWTFPEALAPVPTGISHLEEISYLPSYYRSDVLPAFFDMRSQGAAIAYFNGGGLTSGPCGITATFVLLLDAMTESGLFRTP